MVRENLPWRDHRRRGDHIFLLVLAVRGECLRVGTGFDRIWGLQLVATSLGLLVCQTLPRHEYCIVYLLEESLEDGMCLIVEVGMHLGLLLAIGISQQLLWLARGNFISDRF